MERQQLAKEGRKSAIKQAFEEAAKKYTLYIKESDKVDATDIRVKGFDKVMG